MKDLYEIFTQFDERGSIFESERCELCSTIVDDPDEMVFYSELIVGSSYRTNVSVCQLCDAKQD